MAQKQKHIISRRLRTFTVFFLICVLATSGILTAIATSEVDSANFDYTATLVNETLPLEEELPGEPTPNPDPEPPAEPELPLEPELPDSEEPEETEDLDSLEPPIFEAEQVEVLEEEQESDEEDPDPFESRLVADQECGINITWSISAEGELHIRPTDGTVGTLPNMANTAGAHVPWYNWRESIFKVKIEKGVNANVGLSNAFAGTNITTIDFLAEFTDVSNVYDVHGLFSACNNLTSVELPSNFANLNLTRTRSMFNGCQNLTDVSFPDAFKVSGGSSGPTDMGHMFNDCPKLISVNFPEDFVTPSAINATRMFYNCSSLTALDLSGFNSSLPDSTVSNMLVKCASLSVIKVGENFRWLDASSYPPLLHGDSCYWLSSNTGEKYGKINGVNNITDMPGGADIYIHYDVDIPILAQGTSGGVTWHIIDPSADENPGQLVMRPTNGISGTLANMTDFGPWNEWAESIVDIEVKEGVSAGVSLEGAFRDTNITSVKFIENLDVSNVENFNSLFSYCLELTDGDIPETFYAPKMKTVEAMYRYCSSLTSIKFPANFITSSVTSLVNMFSRCMALENIEGLDSWNTQNVTSMSNLFDYCQALSVVDLSNFNTSKVTSFNRMFRDCNSLTSIDCSNFDTSSAVSFNQMFCAVRTLSELDISNFDTSNATDMRNMFDACYLLPSLDVSSFDTSKVESMDAIFGRLNVLSSLKLGDNFVFAEGTIETSYPSSGGAYWVAASGDNKGTLYGQGMTYATDMYNAHNSTTSGAATYVHASRYKGSPLLSTATLRDVEVDLSYTVANALSENTTLGYIPYDGVKIEYRIGEEGSWKTLQSDQGEDYHWFMDGALASDKIDSATEIRALDIREVLREAGYGTKIYFQVTAVVGEAIQESMPSDTRYLISCPDTPSILNAVVSVQGTSISFNYQVRAFEVKPVASASFFMKAEGGEYAFLGTDVFESVITGNGIRTSAFDLTDFEPGTYTFKMYVSYEDFDSAVDEKTFTIESSGAPVIKNATLSEDNILAFDYAVYNYAFSNPDSITPYNEFTLQYRVRDDDTSPWTSLRTESLTPALSPDSFEVREGVYSNDISDLLIDYQDPDIFLEIRIFPNIQGSSVRRPYSNVCEVITPGVIKVTLPTTFAFALTSEGEIIHPETEDGKSLYVIENTGTVALEVSDIKAQRTNAELPFDTSWKCVTDDELKSLIWQGSFTSESTSGDINAPYIAPRGALSLLWQADGSETSFIDIWNALPASNNPSPEKGYGQLVYTVARAT